jgi:hypothetical protein
MQITPGTPVSLECLETAKFKLGFYMVFTNIYQLKLGSNVEYQHYDWKWQCVKTLYPW